MRCILREMNCPAEWVPGNDVYWNTWNAQQMYCCIKISQDLEQLQTLAQTQKAAKKGCTV